MLFYNMDHGFELLFLLNDVFHLFYVHNFFFNFMLIILFCFISISQQFLHFVVDVIDALFQDAEQNDIYCYYDWFKDRNFSMI